MSIITTLPDFDQLCGDTLPESVSRMLPFFLPLPSQGPALEQAVFVELTVE